MTEPAKPPHPPSEKQVNLVLWLFHKKGIGASSELALVREWLYGMSHTHIDLLIKRLNRMPDTPLYYPYQRR